MMRYLSPGPMSREPHSPVREEFQPVYPTQQSGQARMRTQASPPANVEEENHGCAQFNVDGFMSCETMPSDCRRFGSSGGNKRQGPSGGDVGYGGYSTLPSALGSYPAAEEHFEAEAEVLPLDYSSATTTDPCPTPRPGREGLYERQEDQSGALKHQASEENNGTMPDFIPPRRGKQSVTFAPEVDMKYPPSTNQMQYPPGPPHDRQYPPAPSDRQYPPAPSDRQYPPGPNDRQYPPGPSDRQYPPGPNDRQYPPGPNDRQYPPGPNDRQYPPAPNDRQYPSGPNDRQYPPGPNDGQYPPSSNERLYPPHDRQYPPAPNDRQYPPPPRDRQYASPPHERQYSMPPHDAHYPGRDAHYPSPGRDAQYPPPGHDAQYPPTGHDKQYPPTGHDAQYPSPMPQYPSPSSAQYPPPPGSNSKYPPPNSKYPSPANEMMYPPPPNNADYPLPANAKQSSEPDDMYPPAVNDQYPSPADSMYPPPKSEKYPPPDDDTMYPPPISKKEPPSDESMMYPPPPSKEKFSPPLNEKKTSSASENRCPTPINELKCQSPSKEIKADQADDVKVKVSPTQSDEKLPASDAKNSAHALPRNLGPRLPTGQPSVAKAQKMYCPPTRYGDAAEEPEDDSAQVDEMPEMFPARPGSPSRRSRCPTPNAKPSWPSSQVNGNAQSKPPATPPVGRTCSPGTGKHTGTPTPQDTPSKNDSSSRVASPSKDNSMQGSRPSTPLPEKPLMSSELPIGDLNDPFPTPTDDCIMNIYPNPSQIDASTPTTLPASPVPQTVTGSSPRPAGPVPASQMMVPPMGSFELPPDPEPVVEKRSPGSVPPSQMMMPPMGSFEADEPQNRSCPPNYYGNSSPVQGPPMGGNVDPWNNCYVPPPPWAQQVAQHYHSPTHHRTRSPSQPRERGRGQSPGPQLDEFGRAIMTPARARSRCSSPGALTDEFGREMMTRSPGPGSCGPESTRMWGQPGKRQTPTPRGRSPLRRASSPSPIRGGSPSLSQNYPNVWNGGGYYEPSSNFPNYPTEYCKNGQTMKSRSGSPRGRKQAGNSGLCDNIYPTPRQAQSPSSFGPPPSGPDQQYYYGEGDGGCGDPWRGSTNSACENDPIPSHWRKSPGPTMGNMSPKEWCGTRSRSRSRGRYQQPNQDPWAMDNKSKNCSYPMDDADHGDVAESHDKHSRVRSRSKSVNRAEGKSAPSSPTDDDGPSLAAFPNPKNLKGTTQPTNNEESPVCQPGSRGQTPVDISMPRQLPNNNFKEKQENSMAESNNSESQEGTTRRSRWEKFHGEQNARPQQINEVNNAASNEPPLPRVKPDEPSTDNEKQISLSNVTLAPENEEVDDYPIVVYPPPKQLTTNQQETEPQDNQLSQPPPEELGHNQVCKNGEQESGKEVQNVEDSAEKPVDEVDDGSGPASFDLFPNIPRSGKMEQPKTPVPKPDTKPCQPFGDEEATETDMEMAKYNQRGYSHPSAPPHHQANPQPPAQHQGVPVVSPSPRNISSPVNFYPSPQDVRGYPPGGPRPPDYPYHDSQSSRRARMPPPSHHQYPQQPYPNAREEAHPYRRSNPPPYQNQHYPPQGWQRGASPPPDQRNWQRGSSPPPDPRYWPRGASPTPHDQRRWPRSGSPTQQRGWPQRSASPNQRGWSQRGSSPPPDQRGWPQRGSSPTSEYRHGPPHHNQQMMPQQPQRTKRGYPPNAGYGPHPPCPDDPHSNGGNPRCEQPYPGMPPPMPQQNSSMAMEEEMLQRQGKLHPTSGVPTYQQAAPQAPEHWTGSVPEADDNKTRHSEFQEADHLTAGSQPPQPTTQNCGERDPSRLSMPTQSRDPEPPDSPKRYSAVPPSSPRRYQDEGQPGSPLRHQEANKADSPKRYPPPNHSSEHTPELEGRGTEESQYSEDSNTNNNNNNDNFQTSNQQLSADATQPPVQRQIFQQAQQTSCPQPQQPVQPTYCQQQQPPVTSQQNYQQQTHQQQTHHQQLYQQQKRSQTPIPQNEPQTQQQQAICQQHVSPLQQHSQQQPSPVQQQPTTQQQSATQQQQQQMIQQNTSSPAPQSTSQQQQQQRPQVQPDSYNCPPEKPQTQSVQQVQQHPGNQTRQPSPSPAPSTPVKQHGDGPLPKNYPPTPPSPKSDSWRQSKVMDVETKPPQSPREQDNKQSDEVVPAMSPRQMPLQLPNMSPRKTPPHSANLSPRTSTPQPTIMSPTRKIPSTPTTMSPRKPLSTIDETHPEMPTALKLDIQERCDAEPQSMEDQIQEMQEAQSAPSTPKSLKSDSSRGNESNRGNETSRTNESVRTNDSTRTTESIHEKDEVVPPKPTPSQERDLRADVNRRISNWMNAANMRMEEPPNEREAVARPLYKEAPAPAPSPVKKQPRQTFDRVGSMGDGNNTVNSRSHTSSTHTSSGMGNTRGNHESSGERNTILREMVRRTSTNMGKEAEETKKLDKLAEALAEAERLMETCRAKDQAVKESLGLKPSESNKSVASDFTKMMPRTKTSATSLSRPTVNTQPRQQPTSGHSQSGTEAWRSSLSNRTTDSTTTTGQNRWTARDILNAELERRTSGLPLRGSAATESRENVRGTQSSSELRDIISNLSSRAKARAAPLTTTTDNRSSSSSSSSLTRQDSAMSLSSAARAKGSNSTTGAFMDSIDTKRRSSVQDVRRTDARGDPKMGNMDDEKFASMRDKFLTYFNNYQRNPSSGGGGGSTRH